MSFGKNIVAIAFVCAASLAIPATAFAQVGGGDVPTNAKKQGEKEIPGSTGKTDRDVDGGAMKKDGGSMEKKSGDKM